MTLRIVTMPRFCAFVNDRELTSLQPRRTAIALLVYLGLERSATRDTLLNLFWPERDEVRARHTLSQLLYEVRQDIGEDWLDSRGDTLTLRPTVGTDVAAFERALEQHRPQQALQLYKGGLLDGVHLVETTGFESWLDLRRAQLARLHRRARREVIAELLEQNDLMGALAVATGWCELEPLDDEAQQRTIELLARTGRRAEAIQQFERFEDLLRREELEPFPDLRKLIAAIRAGTVGPDFVDRSKAAAPHSTVATDSDGSLPLPSEFQVVRLIGEGTVARVYLAREPALARMVAVKVLTAKSMLDPVQVRRFEREARVVARIQHPNVNPIFRVGFLDDGRPYLVLQYASGGSLEDRMAAAGSIEYTEARRIVAQIAAGLAATHQMGIVHRDLRPANVLYDPAADRVLITDFGTAALIDGGDAEQLVLTRPGVQLGIPAYSSPEQLRGEAVTDRSDVYSLGVVAFELLTGKLPFQAGTLAAMVTAHVNASPPPVSQFRPEVSKALDQLILRCLNKRPEQRPFAAEVAAALQE
jgi:DNA-binding SARP family transcriptional activator/tRNA A-37 threonylcarbamoyl transferase component Bud32